MGESDTERSRVPREHWYGLVLFLAAVVIRAAAVAALRGFQDPAGADQFGADGVEFEALAHSLSAGRGYSWTDGSATAFRAPGLPAILSVVYWAVGRHPWAAYLLFCLLGALGTVATYGVALRLLDSRGALVAGAISAVYFPSVYSATLFASENLYDPLATLTALAVATHLRSGSIRSLALGGVSLGGLILTRPMAAFVAVALGAAVLVIGGRRGLHRASLAFGVLVISSSVIVAPWIIRNYSVFGTPLIGTTNGGSTFYGANNSLVLDEPRHWGGWVSTQHLPGRKWIDDAPDEVSHDRREWQLGLRWVRDHPRELPRILTLKLTRFWLPDIWSPNVRYCALQLLLTTPVLAIALLGVFLTVRRHSLLPLAWWSLHSILLATVVGALIFWGAARFRDSISGVLSVYAAYALVSIYTWARRTKR